MDKTPFQPLHPSIRGKLYPEYVILHDTIIQYIRPIELPSPSPLKLTPVGRIYDQVIDNFQIRVFTPPSEAPSSGWPCLVWYHGGGWVNGNLDSENGFLTHICKYVNCMVISINYRHAPAFRYPTAHDDALAGYEWVIANAADLGLDIERVAIGGASAGGNISLLTTLNTPHKPTFQLLICPVIDNTATANTTWFTSQHSPFLTPGRMEWYRQQYFTDETQRSQSSPCFFNGEALARSPKTFVAIAECDLLAPEQEAFVGQLEANGVKVGKEVYKGATHSVLALAGIHDVGKKLVHDACGALAEALGTVYDKEVAVVLGQ